MSQIRVSRGSTQIITISHRGGYQNLLQYYMGGGSSRFITILQGGGGVSGDPKFVLRNIWTAPYPIIVLLGVRTSFDSSEETPGT